MRSAVSAHDRNGYKCDPFETVRLCDLSARDRLHDAQKKKYTNYRMVAAESTVKLLQQFP